MGFFSRRKPTPASGVTETLPPHRGAAWEALRARFVPDSGQADTVQGELLRVTTRVHHEQSANGCMNWDRNFEIFCEFSRAHLCDGTFSASTTTHVGRVCDAILTLGAWCVKRDAIDDDVEREKVEKEGESIAEIPSVDLDRLEQLAELWCRAHPTPIPRQPDPRLEF